MTRKTEPKGPVPPAFLIHDVSRLRRTVVDQLIKPLGITRSQWWVLNSLFRHEGESMMQIELARLLDVGKVTVGGLIDRLEENGLVSRIQDKVDRRSKRVVISAKGKKLINRMQQVSVDLNAQIMRGISSQEEKQLAAILARMKDNLIDMDAVPASVAKRRSAGAPRARRTDKPA